MKVSYIDWQDDEGNCGTSYAIILEAESKEEAEVELSALTNNKQQPTARQGAHIMETLRYNIIMKTPRTDLMVSGNSEPTADEYEGLATFTRQLERELAELATKNHQLRIALHEAINRPKGIVPHEAEEFYDQDFYSTTTAQ